MKTTAKLSKLQEKAFRKVKDRLKQEGKPVSEYALFCAGFKTGYNQSKRDHAILE